MIFTFYKARGLNVGSSLVEEDKLELAKKLEQAAKDKGVEFILPTDVIAADKFDENAQTQVVAAGEIPEGWMVQPCRISPALSLSAAGSRFCLPHLCCCFAFMHAANPQVCISDTTCTPSGQLGTTFVTSG